MPPTRVPMGALATKCHLALNATVRQDGTDPPVRSTLMSVPLTHVQRVVPAWIRWTASSASARSSGWGLLASWTSTIAMGSVSMGAPARTWSMGTSVCARGALEVAIAN